MAGIVLKDQMVSSLTKTELTRMAVPDIRIYSSTALNEPCGGLSPRSVRCLLEAGISVVWLPTVDADYGISKGLSGHWIKRRNHRNLYGGPSPRYRVVGENGFCLENVVKILSLVAEHDAVLATGHISPEECLAVLEANRDVGAKVIVTHPNIWLDDFNEEKMRKMTALGGALEFVSSCLYPNRGAAAVSMLAALIASIGPEHIVLSTDGGDVERVTPPQELRIFCLLLRQAGLKEADIERMVRDNPAYLLCGSGSSC
jgi:hypothetical protein